MREVTTVEKITCDVCFGTILPIAKSASLIINEHKYDVCFGCVDDVQLVLTFLTTCAGIVLNYEWIGYKLK